MRKNASPIFLLLCMIFNYFTTPVHAIVNLSAPSVCHGDPDKENKKTRPKESRQVNKTKGAKVQTRREVRVEKEHVLGHTLDLVPNVIVVQGRWWSKNVFRNARLAGLSRDNAWTKACVS